MGQYDRIDAAQAQLLVIDVQERLVPHIAEHELVLGQCLRMIRAARVFGMPIVVSEQYPTGLGPTVTDIRSAAGACERVEKTSFSVWRSRQGREALRRQPRPKVLIIGIETHVCVQQTALELADDRLTPVVLADAVGSRRPIDRSVALDRMRAAGVMVTTVESIIYEMMGESGTELFQRMLPIVR